MSPLRWIHSTGPHFTVTFDELMSDILTEVGGADGAEKKHTLHLATFELKQFI